MFVEKYEGLGVVHVGLLDTDIDLIAQALDAYLDGVCGPEDPDHLLGYTDTLATSFKGVAYALQLRRDLYEAKTAGKLWPSQAGTAQDPEPTTGTPGPLRRFLARLLGPLAPFLAKTAPTTALYVWLLGPEAVKEFKAMAQAILAMRGQS